jgi:FlaG/FlaF family flagellin (archaellin)
VGRSADIEPVKPLRIFLIAFVVLVVAGTIASAATGGVHGKPTSPGHTETEAPEPTETEAPEPTETEAPEAEETTSDESGTAPDFSACDGRTGLDNAICRHQALLKVKPDNPGLTNSLAHLQANLAAHAAKQAAKDTGIHGNSGTHGNSGSHGPSGS